MHALIIEQDIWITLMIEDVLRERGFTSFAYASSREEAVAAARIRCPNIITSDIRLGASSGLDAVREICSGKTIPALFVTATPWEAREGMSGAVIVAKPFGRRELKEAVLRATGV
jgi:DNA-binding response OmpR family regulator